MPFVTSNLLTAMLALVAVIALVLLFGRFTRSSFVNRTRAGRRLAVSESLMIDRSRSIRIVSCDGRECVLLVGGGSDVLLGWLPSPESPR